MPGDKSVSHRAVLLGAVNDGPVTVTGFLRSADTLATVAAARALGVEVDEHADRLVVQGRGWEGLSEPDDVIDVANSGTLIRLLPGTGGLVSFPLRAHGRREHPSPAHGPRPRTPGGHGSLPWWDGGPDTLPPLAIRGGALRGITHRMAMASAQVKSCLLLAGLRAAGETTVVEPAASRDHTERMIRYTGGRVEREGPPDGPGHVRVWPAKGLHMDALSVPGDFSSAAFFLVAALLTADSEVTIENAGLNPSRTGLLAVLRRMGADLHVEPADTRGPEPEGSITARSSALTATDVGASEVPDLIDELPLFLLAAAKAEGTSRLRGAAELRAKESDRLSAMAAMLRALGVQVIEYPDGMDVVGDPERLDGRRHSRSRRPPHGHGGRRRRSRLEGRGTSRRHRLHLRLLPRFHRGLLGVGRRVDGRISPTVSAEVRLVIIAIDGPAGSGKSTIAREVAKRLGMRYLDTGAMYRAVTLLALEAGLVPDRIGEAGALAKTTPLRFEERPDDLTRVFVGEREVTDEIRGRLVSQNVSAVSADAGVRAVLTERQRAEAARGNVVLEGRDMGTVVVPEADLKVFLTASIEERARRRQLQLQAKNVPEPLDRLIADITARDAYDSGRALAPLRKADDAVEIDTTGLTIDQVIDLVCARAAAARPSAPAARRMWRTNRPRPRRPRPREDGVSAAWCAVLSTRFSIDSPTRSSPRCGSCCFA